MSRVLYRFQKASIPLGRDRRLLIPEWTIRSGETWSIIGPTGSGKSTLGRALAWVDREGFVLEGRRNSRKEEDHPRIPGLSRNVTGDRGVSWVSLERVRDIHDRLRRDDDSEYLGKVDEGTSLEDFIHGERGLAQLASELVDRLQNRGIRHLSTGEFRQVLLARELADSPALAILDDPFDGLDSRARGDLLKRIRIWREQGIALVLILTRRDDVPERIDGEMTIRGDRLVPGQGDMEPRDIEGPKMGHPVIGRPHQSGVKTSMTSPLVAFSGLSLSYGNHHVLKDIHWTINAGERWLLTGPNGSGKSTLVNLISGEEPRGYGQPMSLFGRKRGSGETLAEIQSHLGMVSADLNEKISVHATVEEVLISGLRSSLVVIGPCKSWERESVEPLLENLGLRKDGHRPFGTLSFGIQRLLVIARAIVRHPPLLLLDEPMHGLDSEGRALAGALIQKNAETFQGAILFISHRVEDAPFTISRHCHLVPHADGGSTAVIGVR